jgi:NADPH:quinone reductase-like Zn-dependent oxidoreductase
MRAIVIDRFQTPGSLRDIPEPALDPDSVLVRITYAGVNPVDWKIRDGVSSKHPFPLVLGQDFAGVVERVGEQVDRVATGARVFGCARDHGSYAEETVIRDRQADSPFTTIPEGVTDQQAAALPTPGLTALASLEILGVARGTKLLVVGAAGAVGSAAVQIARQRFATVAAVVRPGQEGKVRELGADEVYESNDELVAARRDRPFDAVLDLVSDAEALKHAAPLLRKGGKLVTTIHVADEVWFHEHGIVATNVVMNETPQSSPRGLDELARMVAAGTLIVDVGSVEPFDQAACVLDEVKTGKLSGKVLLRV